MEITSRQEQREAKRKFWKEHVQLWQERGLSLLLHKFFSGSC
jgi:hypothetical protein